MLKPLGVELDRRGGHAEADRQRAHDRRLVDRLARALGSGQQQTLGEARLVQLRRRAHAVDERHRRLPVVVHLGAEDDRHLGRPHVVGLAEEDLLRQREEEAAQHQHRRDQQWRAPAARGGAGRAAAQAMKSSAAASTNDSGSGIHGRICPCCQTW